MTNKVFYQAAAAEVASGAIDSALWIKVNAELPEADDHARQAKYIALRAQEMATEAAAYKVRRWLPHSFGTWIVYLVVVSVVAYAAAALTAATGTLGSTPAPVAVLIGVIALAVFVAARAGHGAAPTAADPASTPARPTH